MYCSKCGKEIKKEDKFCGNCGTEINLTNSSKKRKMITNIICVVVIIAFIGGIQLIVNNANKSSMEHAKTAVEEQFKNNSSTNKYKKEIKDKWEATLPYNNTNYLECVVYNIDQNELYLKYSQGICIVDKNNEIDRLVNGDLNGALIGTKITNAQKGKGNYVYMTSTEFEKIIK